MKSAIFRSQAARREMERAYQRLLEETSQARPQQVSTRFGETHLLVAGPEGAPPLVLLHGKWANSALALREGHAFLDRFRVYALDIIGQSVKSADVRLRWHGTDYSSWLLDVLDGLRLPKAHLFGASGGAFIARTLAERAPERIDRLVLLVPAGIVKAPAGPVFTKMVIPMLLYRTFAADVESGARRSSLIPVPALRGSDGRRGALVAAPLSERFVPITLGAVTRTGGFFLAAGDPARLV